MNKAFVLPAFLLLLLSACGPTPDDVIEQHRADTEAKLKQIDDIGKSALTYKEPPAPISLPDGTKLSFADGGNAALMQVEEFAEGAANKKAFSLSLNSAWLGVPRGYLTKGPRQLEAASISTQFDEFFALKYVVLIRTLLSAKPKVAGDSSFSPGFWQGDLMLFEIESGKCLGRVELSAVNDAQVKVRDGRSTSSLGADLLGNARNAVKAALDEHTDGEVFAREQR